MDTADDTEANAARGEVGARVLRIGAQTREEVWASTFGARRLGEYACGVKPIRRAVVVVESGFSVVVLPCGGCARHRTTPLFVGISS